MSNLQKHHTYQLGGLLFGTILLFVFYFQYTDPNLLDECDLCDKHQYAKVYRYFEQGQMEQTNFPFYTRPIVPLLASIVPGLDMDFSFHTVNFIFILAGVIALYYLWWSLGIRFGVMCLGFFWLLFHWTGIIRQNLADNITVDVPVYFVQALVIILFFRKNYTYLYLLTPIAILQKESFVPIMIVLIAINVYQHMNREWFDSSKHLIYSLLLGIAIQKLVIWLMPDQVDQRNSLLALFYHLKLLVDDPSRLIRWFAALGSAFGLFPILILWRFRMNQLKKTIPLSLILLSLVFLAFGLTAGEDMTRIIYLGFPFIMTLALMNAQSEKWWVLATAVLLSVPFMHLYPFSWEMSWAVDYADMTFVNHWASYYLFAIIVMGLLLWFSDKKSLTTFK